MRLFALLLSLIPVALGLDSRFDFAKPGHDDQVHSAAADSFLLPLPTPIPMFNQLFSKIRVYTNGFIEMGSENLTTSVPAKYPLGSEASGETFQDALANVISVFSSPMVHPSRGQVSVR
ncbi:hypothetical protein Ciccas_013424 [Cichlidogyrus casuarinus]|uniref:Uncharacterized protein n=1 Tax=Cichlidogyrus casuarinus TaxID=1844966 RepID=A0ABD2PKL7_9PLAT